MSKQAGCFIRGTRATHHAMLRVWRAWGGGRAGIPDRRRGRHNLSGEAKIMNTASGTALPPTPPAPTTGRQRRGCSVFTARRTDSAGIAAPALLHGRCVRRLVKNAVNKTHTPRTRPAYEP